MNPKKETRKKYVKINKISPSHEREEGKTLNQHILKALEIQSIFV